MASVESVKAASDVYAPVSGRVTAINDALTANPALVNESAEDKAWFVKLGAFLFQGSLSPSLCVGCLHSHALSLFSFVEKGPLAPRTLFRAHSLSSASPSRVKNAPSRVLTLSCTTFASSSSLTVSLSFSALRPNRRPHIDAF